MSIPLLLLTLTLSAQDWPQWRGPHRDGALVNWTPPPSWPEKLNLAWKITVGEGHSSPVCAGGVIYQFARQDEQETLFSIDAAQGKILWQQSYAAPYQVNPAATRHGKGPKSTPVVSGGSVYTLGISGILSSFDAATGKLRWRKEFSKQFRQTSPMFGTATSPLIHRGLLIVHIGGHDDGALTAFDAQSGDVKWSWKGDGPSYASPIVVEDQIITQTQSSIVAVSASTGELLWRIPFTTPFVQNIVTPIAYNQTLILSGLNNPAFAIRPPKPDRIWQNADASMYMNSPVLSGDLLFGFTSRNRGQFFCLDANTGKIHWTSDPRQGENAAIVSAPGLLFLLTNDADLILARPTAKGFEVVRRYKVAESPTWAHPLILNRGIGIKDAKTLSLWQ